MDTRIPELLDIYKTSYLKMSDGVELRLLSFVPEKPKATIFLNPGLGTLVLSWERLLDALWRDNFEVYYFESREKYTARYPGKTIITRERMIQDVVEAINQLELKDYIAIGSSLGSTILIHAMAKKLISPKHAILVGHSAEMKLPVGLKLILPLVNDFIYKLSKPLVKWYILSKYTDKEADPEQYYKYSLGIDLSVPSRFRKIIRAWAGNKVWDDLPLIETHCILVGAEKDKLHASDLTKRIAEMIPNADYVDLETNKAAHDKPLIDLINKILEEEKS